MSKILRLTEKDLTRLVKKVIKEQIQTRGEQKHEFNENFVLLEGFSYKAVQSALSSIPFTVKYIAFINCGKADFGNIDLCNDLPFLKFVNLKGTPNNLEETQGGCYESNGNEGYYDFSSRD